MSSTGMKTRLSDTLVIAISTSARETERRDGSIGEREDGGRVAR